MKRDGSTILALVVAALAAVALGWYFVWSAQETRAMRANTERITADAAARVREYHRMQQEAENLAAKTEGRPARRLYPEEE